MPVQADSSLVRRAPGWIKQDLETAVGRGANLLNSSRLRPVVGRLLKGDPSLDWEEALNQILKSGDNPQRELEALLLLFSRWADVDWEGALKRAESLEPSLYLHYIKHEIFMKMIARNPQEAALYYEKNREALYAHKYYFLRELTRLWASQAPEAAWEWLVALKDDGWQNDTIRAFFSGLDGSPGTMEKYLKQVISDEALRDRTSVREIIQDWAKYGFKDTVNWIESQEPKIREELWKDVVIGGAESDFDLAAGYLSKVPKASLPDAITSIAGVMQRKQGSEAALDWMTGILPKGGGYYDFGILSDWSTTDPESAQKWLLRFSPGDQKIRDYALEAYVSSSRNRNREETVKMAQSIKSPKLQKNALESALMNWKREDPVAAGKWVDRFQGDARIKAGLKKIIGKEIR